MPDNNDNGQKPPRKGWYRNPNLPVPESYRQLPTGEPVDMQPDIDPQLQYWCDLYGSNPYGFVRDMFEWGKPYSILAKREGPYVFQAEILEDMTKRLQQDPSAYFLSIASGKGIGKTALLATLVLWHFMMHRHSKTNVLGVTGDSIDQRIWNEISIWFDLCRARHHFRRFKGGKLTHVYHDTWYASYQLWQSNKPEALFGSHAEYLSYFIDEACGIPNEILQHIESGLVDEHVMMVAISNPTRLRSRFRQYFPGGTLAHCWQSWQIDSRTTERYNPARVAALLEEAGQDEDNAWFRINVRGLFPLADAEQFITDGMVQRANERWNAYGQHGPSTMPEGTPERHEPINIGVDVARYGPNKTVFLMRQGPRILMKRVYAKKEIDETAELLIDLLMEYRQWKPRAHIDIIGYGAGVYAIARKHEVCTLWQCEVYEINSALPATGPNAERFANLRMELWDYAKEWIRHTGMIDPKDAVLIKQVTSAAAFVNPGTGRLQLESKDDMAARGIDSPDEADALSYSFGGQRAEHKKRAGAWGRG